MRTVRCVTSFGIRSSVRSEHDDPDERTLLPGGQRKGLLRSCRAPCSGEEVMDALLASRIDYTLFFYDPNIHLRRETSKITVCVRRPEH